MASGELADKLPRGAVPVATTGVEVLPLLPPPPPPRRIRTLGKKTNLFYLRRFHLSCHLFSKAKMKINQVSMFFFHVYATEDAMLPPGSYVYLWKYPVFLQ